MTVGKISRHLTPKLLLVLVLQFLLLAVLLGYRSYKDSSSGCIGCHGDRARLERLGAPWAYVTQEMVEEESRHPNVQCRDCHLGDGRAEDKERAHRGMLKMLIVSESAGLLPRSEGYPGPLRQTGDDEMFALMPKTEIDGEYYILDNVRNILWHDRDPLTFGFDPGIAEKTCSKRGCHPDKLKQFRKTTMGRNYRQRYMRTWLDPYGPHNCGPSFADPPPPDLLQEPSFAYENTERISRNLNAPFNRGHAEDKQRFCNVCHAGCLDCHYTPSEREGRHAFTGRPDSLSCSGYGRGASTCHPGAMSSRRGETYIGGDYSLPQGMEPDVHYREGIQCIDCHQTGRKGMGDMERKATCQDCHIEAEEALQRSIHREMDCATCHISQLGGYQLTIWGPGPVAERRNPFKKYSLYYGIQSPPILMRDQEGRWMPVKVWPHSVGNIKEDVPPSPSIQFRWPDGQTRDAYYIVGTFDGLPENNKHLLWIEIEQAAHPYGKARGCESCHASEGQTALSEWEFYDTAGAEPFTGSYRIVADEKGLRFTDMNSHTPIIPLPGARLSDFASWVYLKDRWRMPGDFSIKADRSKYLKYRKLYDDIEKTLEEIGPPPDNPKLLLRYRAVRSEAVHDLDGAEGVIRESLREEARNALPKRVNP